MPRACRVVDDSGVVWNVVLIKVVIDGVVRTVASARAIKDGVVRQFWPPP
jgi:hypothetical protein